MTREIKSAGVVGLGTMGAGIVEVFAKAGLSVVAVDSTPELAARGEGFLTGSLERQVSRGRLDAAVRDEIVGRVRFAHDLSDLADVDLVIEAVPERIEIKTAIFSQLDDIIRPDAVLATNTSSLSVTALAAATKHPERVIGMHFFNPAPVLALVEVITTLMADRDLVDAVRELAITLGKKPVVVGDRAGFVANALLITYLARAIRTYETGHVSREDLDDAARMGIGFPMGPLTLSDLIGLDVVKEVCDVLYNATKEPSSAPPQLLEQMVAAGRLGRKTGHGFYQYEKPGSGTVVDPASDQQDGTPALRIAVIGDDAVAGEWVRVLNQSPSEVRAIGPDTDANLDGVQLVLLAGVDAPECDDCGSEDECAGCNDEVAPWFTDALEQIGADTVVAITDDELTAMAAYGALDENIAAVGVRLHGATKAGQVAEVVRPAGGETEAVQTVAATLRSAGLRTIVARDRAGLVVDALLLPHLNDAVTMLDSGYASVADIDTAMTAGCGYPQGPFAYIDQLGAPQVYLGLNRMYDETGQPALHPSALLADHFDREFTR